MQRAQKEIAELNIKLAPLRKEKQAQREAISKLEKELVDLQAKLAEAKRAQAESERVAAEAKASRERQQKMIAVLEETLGQWRKQYEQRLLYVQIAGAQIRALRQGQPVASVGPGTYGFKVSPPPVPLDDTQVYGKIDPASFITLEIYQQALRERDRQVALRKDLEQRLAMMGRWRKEQANTSAEFAALLRNETSGVVAEVLDLAAPVDDWLVAAKVSKEVVIKYKQAVASLKYALAVQATIEANTHDERNAGVQTAVVAVMEAIKAAGVGGNEVTAKQLEKIAKVYEAGGKLSLAATAADRETAARLFCDALTVAGGPWATVANAGGRLVERAGRYYVINQTLEGLTDQRRTTEMLYRRLEDKIDSLDRNSKESQRIVDLWRASQARKGGTP